MERAKGRDEHAIVGQGKSSQKWKTKSSSREPGEFARTHSPVHLRDFFLPPMDLRGLQLEEALERVNQSYVEACEVVGEVALPLVFALPGGPSTRIECETGYATVDSIIHLLAGVSGMTEERSGVHFIFKRPNSLAEGQVETRALENSTWTSIREVMGRSGLSFSTGFREVANGADMISVATESAEDLALIDSLVKSEASAPKVLQSVHPRLIRLPAGNPWELEGRSVVGNGKLSAFLHNWSSIEGVEMKSNPSMLAKLEDSAELRVIDEVMIPEAGSRAFSF